MKRIIILGSLLLHLCACQSDIKPEKKEEPKISIVNPNLKLLPCPAIPEEGILEDVYMQSFSYTGGRMIFGVNKLRLGGKTPAWDQFPFDNTRKGTEVHLNIDNERHHLSNTNVFEYDLPNGTYQLYAFINRSYRVAVQNEESIISRSIVVKNGELTKSTKNEEAALIYNMPYGKYKKEAAKKIIVDFVLYHIDLESDGKYIKVIINNGNTFEIRENKPYFLEGMTVGKHNCRLELYNKENKLLQPPVESEFVVE